MSLFEAKIFQEGFEFVSQRAGELTEAAQSALSIPTFESTPVIEPTPTPPVQPIYQTKEDQQAMISAQVSAEIDIEQKLAEIQQIHAAYTEQRPDFTNDDFLDRAA